MHYPDHLRIITVCLTWQNGFVSIDSAPLQKSYMTAMEIWLLERAEPLYKIYPWKALLRADSRGCAETEYGQNLMRKMMMSYDPDPKEYARLAGFGYRMVKTSSTERYITDGYHNQKVERDTLGQLLNYIETYSWQKHLQHEGMHIGNAEIEQENNVKVEMDNTSYTENTESKASACEKWYLRIWNTIKRILKLR